MKNKLIIVRTIMFSLLANLIRISKHTGTILRSLSFLLFLILHLLLSFNYCEAQWYQITLPVSGSVYQMQFINSNTGWAVISQTNVGYILIRTTNQGTNWSVIYSDSSKVGKFQFLNDTLGYAMGYSQGYHLISKTTNGGYNWTVMQSSFNDIYSGFYMVNADTGWVNAFAYPTQITLRTTNGFQTIEQISSGAGGTPATLYFFKEKYNGEYYGYLLGAGLFWKTTNSGFTWQQINAGTSGEVSSFSFINKDTGWAVIGSFTSNNNILETNNGGTNWIIRYLDSHLSGRAIQIFALNKNKIWCGAFSNVVFACTNSGITWGTQTSSIYSNAGIYMVDSLLGFTWSGSDFYTARTTNGGGVITSIIKKSDIVPSTNILCQNYPNPFNSTTTIKYKISKTKDIRITVFDILGKELKTIVNKKQSSGTYIVSFDAGNLSSGIYFYQLSVDNKQLAIKKMLLIK